MKMYKCTLRWMQCKSKHTKIHSSTVNTKIHVNTEYIDSKMHYYCIHYSYTFEALWAI